MQYMYYLHVTPVASMRVQTCDRCIIPRRCSLCCVRLNYVVEVGSLRNVAISSSLVSPSDLRSNKSCLWVERVIDQRPIPDH